MPEIVKEKLMVDVFNREQAEGYDPQQARVVDLTPPAIISISCPDEPANLKYGWSEVLRLEFHDISMSWEWEQDRLVPMSHEQAQKVVDFAIRHAHRNLFVHCDAGVSRSVAVGLFLSEWQERILNLHAVNTTEFYNPWVSRLLNRVLWREVYKEDLVDGD